MIDAVRERLSLEPGRLIALLPVLLIVMLLVGGAMFCLVTLLPAVNEFDSLNQQATAASAQLDRRATQQAQAQADNIETMLSQAQNSLADLDTAADQFWSELQIDSILDRLYAYADAAQVTLTTLQSPQVQTSGRNSQSRDATAAPPPYNVRVLQLDVHGELPRLMNFMARLREAALPTVVVSNLAMSAQGGRGNEGSSLRLELLVYTSPHASGDVFSTLPDLNTPSPVPPTATNTPTPTNTPTATNTPTNTFTPTSTFTPTNTYTPSSTPTALPTETPTVGPTSIVTFTPSPIVLPPTATLIPTEDPCPGAPAPRFQPGDNVVVDFNDRSSLRVLARPRTDSSDVPTIIQAYDNDIMRIIGGPLCGVWNGGNLWYWNVSIGGLTGWVGDSSAEGQWLCPMDDPECNAN